MKDYKPKEPSKWTKVQGTVFLKHENGYLMTGEGRNLIYPDREGFAESNGIIVPCVKHPSLQQPDWKRLGKLKESE